MAQTLRRKAQASLANDKFPQRIAAPYGLLHGKLSEEFRDRGAKTSSRTTGYVFSPQQNFDRRSDFEAPSTAEAKLMLIGYAVHQMAADQIEQERIALTEPRELNAFVWMVVHQITGGDRSEAKLNEVYKTYNLLDRNGRTAIRETILVEYEKLTDPEHGSKPD